MRTLAALLLLVACARPPGRAAAPGPPQAGEAAVLADLDRDAVRLRVTLRPPEPRLSDRLQVGVEASAASGVELEEPDPPAGLAGFLLKDVRRELPREEDGRVVRTTTWVLEPLVSGEFTLPPVEVAFTDHRPGAAGDRHLVATDPLAVSVSTVVAQDMVGLDALRPPALPAALPVPPAGWLPWAGAAAAAVALAGALFFLLRRRSAPVGRAEPDPRERAARALDALVAAGLLARGAYKQYYAGLTGVIRRYIEDTTGVRAPEQTTEEFLRTIRCHPAFAEQWRRELGGFLESADLVKFAAQVPGAEAARESLATARRFLDFAEPPGGAQAA